MMWILILVLAHLFYAAVFMLDKYVLSAPKSNPITYSFYVGAMGIAILILIPISFFIPNNAFVMPNGSEIFWSLVAGIFQILAFIFFYKALDSGQGEVSRVVPYTGAITSIFVLIFSSLILKEFLSGQQILAFVLLVLGSLVVSFKKGKLFGNKIWWMATLGALFFALFWVTTKYLFLGTSFISGLIWVRTGVAIIAFALLLSKKNRKTIFSETKASKPKTTGLFVLSRVLNAMGSLFIYWAVFLGSVSIANALQGLQYLFVLILALLLFKKMPSMKEQFGKESLFQKVVAIALICAGLGLLVI